MRVALVRASILSRWTAAHLLARAEEYVFDYAVYPFALYGAGPYLAPHVGLTRTDGYWLGFGAMCAVSVGLNILYLHLYERSGIDWFGFEAAQRLEARLARQAVPPIRLAVHAAVFVYLSIWHSPLFATLWHRPGNACPREQSFRGQPSLRPSCWRMWDGPHCSRVALWRLAPLPLRPGTRA